MLTALNPDTYLHDGFLRVRSTGTSLGSSKTLVADLTGANPLLYAYISKYETLSSAFENSYYGARDIYVQSSAVAGAANLASPALGAADTINWNAPTGSDDTSVCDRLYYNDGSTQGRAAIEATRTNLPAGADWAETGNYGTIYEPCAVTFTTGMTFDGPVYTRDAPYLSYGIPNATSANGPVFIGPADASLPPVSTGWSTSSTPAAPSSSHLYNSFPDLGGAPSSLSTPSTADIIQEAQHDLELPANANDAQASATCVYTGPTRITVTGATATILSPLTQATGANACYTNTNSAVTGLNPNAGTGVDSAQVPVATTTIYVRNLGSPSSWSTASSGSPIFSLSTLSGGAGPTAGTPTVTTADAGYLPATGQNPSHMLTARSACSGRASAPMRAASRPRTPTSRSLIATSRRCRTHRRSQTRTPR